MSVSYHRLWKVLIDEEISHTELRQRANISPNTMTKLFHNEKVSMDILERICDTLQVDFGDIVEFLPNDKSWTDM